MMIAAMTAQADVALVPAAVAFGGGGGAAADLVGGSGPCTASTPS